MGEKVFDNIWALGGHGDVKRGPALGGFGVEAGGKDGDEMLNETKVSVVVFLVGCDTM